MPATTPAKHFAKVIKTDALLRKKGQAFYRSPLAGRSTFFAHCPHCRRSTCGKYLPHPIFLFYTRKILFPESPQPAKLVKPKKINFMQLDKEDNPFLSLADRSTSQTNK